MEDLEELFEELEFDEDLICEVEFMSMKDIIEKYKDYLTEEDIEKLNKE